MEFKTKQRWEATTARSSRALSVLLLLLLLLLNVAYD